MDFSEFDVFVTVTGFNHYIIREPIVAGQRLLLMRETGNEYDKSAVAVYLSGEKIGYVANTIETVKSGTMSSSQFVEIMEASVYAEVVELSSYDAICKVEGVKDFDKMCLKAFEYYNNGEHEEAVELFLEMEKRYSSVMLLQYISDCFIKLGRFEDALKYSEEAIRREPESQVSMMMYGVSLSETGTVDKAAEIFSRLLENNKNADIYCERAVCYMRMERIEEALSDIEKCLELSPQKVNALRIKEEILKIKNSEL